MLEGRRHVDLFVGMFMVEFKWRRMKPRLGYTSGDGNVHVLA